MNDTASQDAEQLHARLRLMVRVRWFAVVFAVGQVLAYEMAEYPPGLREAALVAVGVLLAGNVALALFLRRASVEAYEGLALASVLLDGLVASAITWVYSFDAVSAMFAILFIIPIEGAVFFQLRGAMASWAGLAVLYTGREIFAVRYDNPFEVTSLTFRVGMLGIVAVTVGMLTRRLATEHASSEAALAELRRVEQWRSRLVGVLAHDVRSSLTAIQGMAATVAEHGDELPPEKIRDFAARARARAEHLQALSTDLLELARHESDELELHLRPTPLRPLVSRVLEQIGDDDVTVDIPAGFTVEVDPARMEQVIANLVSNARDHGAPPIEISACVEDEMASVTVRDHGEGVPGDLLAVLFDPFVHGDHEGSVGLGLWIVRRLVEAHGGAVNYSPTNAGTVFTVTLPLGARSGRVSVDLAEAPRN